MIDLFAVTAALNALPVCYADRVDPRKPEQLATIARAVATVADEVDEAAYLLTLIRWESAGCIAVHSGEHKGPGRGLFQLEGQSKRYTGPFVGLGEYPTLNASYVAVSIIRRSWQCGPGPANRFTAYAGRKCGTKWKTLSRRIRTFHVMQSVLWREIAAREKEAA